MSSGVGRSSGCWLFGVLAGEKVPEYRRSFSVPLIVRCGRCSSARACVKVGQR